MRLKLRDGDRVCIVGGGPAGSFAALHLLSLMRRRGLAVEVRVFEPRDFNRPGLGGCNGCAGVLSSRLLQGLKSLDISLPAEVIQAKITTYAAHFDDEVFELQQPDPQREIISIYRGGGPRLYVGEQTASFDRFLLSQAVARGAQHVPHRVRRIRWEGQPVLYTGRARFPAEFLVLACGINSRAPMSSEFGYVPPKTAVMAQDEILRPKDWPQGTVSAFFRYPPGLTFGALIPKGRYLNVSLLGKGFTRDTVEDFLEVQGLAESLGTSGVEGLCGCNPRIAITPAKGFFGERWVAVGDAAVTRLYKDGIGSAFFTARQAMQVAVERGISRGDFRKRYVPLCREIARDNFYGRILFSLWHYTLRKESLLNAWLNALRMEEGLSAEHRLHMRILWGMFTGDEPYRDLFWLSLSREGLWSLMMGYLQGRRQRIWQRD